MRAASSQEDAPNRRPANQARQLRPQIYPVLELEEALYAVRVYIIGNGRAAERNCLFEDALQAGVQAVKIPPASSGEPSCADGFPPGRGSHRHRYFPTPCRSF